MIAAVLFDLYETLVTERNTTPARASSLGERLGLDSLAFRKAWKPQRVRIIRGEISFANALLEIGAMLGRRLDADVVRSLSDERRLEKAEVFQQFDPLLTSNIGADAPSLPYDDVAAARRSFGALVTIRRSGDERMRDTTVCAQLLSASPVRSEQSCSPGDSR